MKIKQLIKKLSKLDPNLDVVICVNTELTQNTQLIQIDEISIETYNTDLHAKTQKSVLLNGDGDRGLHLFDNFEWVGDES